VPVGAVCNRTSERLRKPSPRARATAPPPSWERLGGGPPLPNPPRLGEGTVGVAAHNAVPFENGPAVPAPVDAVCNRTSERLRKLSFWAGPTAPPPSWGRLGGGTCREHVGLVARPTAGEENVSATPPGYGSHLPGPEPRLPPQGGGQGVGCGRGQEGGGPCQDRLVSLPSRFCAPVDLPAPPVLCLG